MKDAHRLRFRPHPLLRSGHAQTLSGYFLSRVSLPYTASRCEVALDDGDRILLHDDCPGQWSDGGPTALMVHGLAGCHDSPYMIRIAAKLNAHGVRTFRMDLRGCGAGTKLARRTYHAGRSGDVAASLEAIARLCPGSPTVLLGFSLGGAITLKMLGECGSHAPGALTHAVAVCPPVDLLTCARAIRRPSRRFYERYLVTCLLQQLAERRRLVPEAPVPELPGRIGSMWEFDELYTSRVEGFGSAESYYCESSAARLLPDIRLPTLILTAADDPMVPIEIFDGMPLSTSTRLIVTEHGGHMGYIAQAGEDPDRRWLDWRVIEWSLGHDVLVERGLTA